MDNESKKEGRILRLPEVMGRTGLSRSTIYNYINQSLFPHPVRLGPHSVGWLAHDLDEWIETRVKTIRVKGKRFDDGEIKRSIEDNVRGFHAVVVASAAGNPNENEKETRMLLRAAKKKGNAAKTTLVLPYMWYGRSDSHFGERTEGALIDTIETLAPLCDNVLLADPHNVTLTSTLFNCAANGHVKAVEPIQFAYPYSVQLQDMMNRGMISRDTLMLTHADMGGPKRIGPEFRDCVYGTLKLVGRDCNQDDWSVGIKDRDKVTGKSRYKGFTADVKGHDVVIFEDMIASGGTAIELADMLKSLGARSIIMFATNGLFTPKSATETSEAIIRKLENSQLDAIFLMDTYDHRATNPGVHAAIEASQKIHVIGAAPFIAGVIYALHIGADNQNVNENSVSAIMRGTHRLQHKMSVPAVYKPGFPMLRLQAA